MLKIMRSLQHLCSSTLSTHYFMSSSNKGMVIKQCLKAFWAQRIITQIGEQTNLPSKIKDSSFRQNIINLSLKQGQNYKTYKELLGLLWYFQKDLTKNNESYTENKVKEEVFQALKTGVKLNEKIFNQQRFLDAIKKENLVFWPNILVSRHIFQKLLQPPSQLIISGPYGISKSISLVFYIHFSNFLTRYYYQLGQLTDQQFKQKMQGLNKQLKLQKGAIKYWYWSIDKKKLQSNQKINLKKIILNQANQLSQDARAKLSNLQFNEFIEELKAQYQKHGIDKFIPVIDQINVAASYMRKWNEFVFENKEDLSKLEQQQSGYLKDALDPARKHELLKDIKQNEQNKQIAIYLNKLVSDFIKLSHDSSRWILNSSANIESDLLQNQQLRNSKAKIQSSHQIEIKRFYKLGKQYKELSLGLQKSTHSSPQFYIIDYHSQISTPKGNIDFWHFFWSNIEQALSAQFTEEQKQKFKQKYLQLASEQKTKSYYRFLHIREYLTQLKIPNYFQVSEINNIINKLFLDFQRYCIEQYQKKVKDFIRGKGIHKQRAVKSRFMYLLMRIAEDQVDQQKGQQQITASYVALDRCIGSIPLEQYIFSSNHNKDFLPFSKDNQLMISQGILKFSWKAQDFIKIMSFTFHRGNKKYESWKQYLQNIQSYQGVQIEEVIHRVLYPKSKVQFEFHTKKVEDRLRIFEINHFTPFKSCPNKASVNFKEQFSQMFKMAKDKQKEWILGRPKDQDNKLDSKNIAVDFVLMKCQKIQSVDNQQTFQYTLYLFDVATGSDLSSKKGNAKEYYEVIKEQLQKPKDRFIFKHVFLCYQSRCTYSKEDLFEYAALEKMVIKLTQDQYSLLTLQDIINFKHLNGLYKYYKQQKKIQQKEKKPKQQSKQQKKKSKSKNQRKSKKIKSQDGSIVNIEINSEDNGKSK